MTPVQVYNLSVSNVGYVVLLRNPDSKKTVPIFIGGPEAQAIALKLNNVEPPRPMTHDLMKNIMDAFEGRLERVEVSALTEGTFYGQLIIDFESQEIEIDARPSDAIALALRYGAPIFVADEVMEEAGVLLEEGDQESGEDESDEGKSSGESEEHDRLKRLKERLNKAIEEERYEDAAKLRDEIRNATSSN